MKRLRLVLLFASLIAVAPTQSESYHRVKIKITGIRNTEGNILLSIFNQKQGFPSDPDKAIAYKVFKVSDKECEISFETAFPEIAVSLVHDENKNDQIDYNFFGYPLEGIGVSNNAYERFSSPRYEKAVVSTHHPTTDINIKMKYY